MYFIKTVYNDKQIYFVSKEIEPKSNLPLVKFSTTIDTATKYNNLDVTIYTKKNFNNMQMNEIYLGMKNHIDVSIYSNPDFDWRQMHILRISLEDGLDVTSYADPNYNWKKMNKIRKVIKKS